MASMREIKNRITATQKTSQITKAMNMVSASKLRKAEKQYRAFTPTKDRIKTILEDILATYIDVTHPLLEPRDIKKTGYLLITSDRGLAGPYNNNLLKQFKQHLREQHSKADDYVIGTIGFKGYSYCKRNRLTLINSESIGSRDDLEFIDFQALSRAFISMYQTHQIDKLVVVYNHYVNTLTQTVQMETLLPITHLKKQKDVSVAEFLFEPSPQVVIDHLLPIFMENSLFGIILDAKTSEHAARMTAMKSATDNAEEVMTKLNLYYNRARQNAITKELTDIIGGANAVT
jgi:F-type H+-transporting ATPase subunit gamma